MVPIFLIAYFVALALFVCIRGVLARRKSGQSRLLHAVLPVGFILLMGDISYTISSLVILCNRTAGLETIEVPSKPFGVIWPLNVGESTSRYQTYDQCGSLGMRRFLQQSQVDFIETNLRSDASDSYKVDIETYRFSLQPIGNPNCRCDIEPEPEEFIPEGMCISSETVMKFTADYKLNTRLEKRHRQYVTVYTFVGAKDKLTKATFTSIQWPKFLEGTLYSFFRAVINQRSYCPEVPGAPSSRKIYQAADAVRAYKYQWSSVEK